MSWIMLGLRADIMIGLLDLFIFSDLIKQQIRAVRQKKSCEAERLFLKVKMAYD